MLKFLRYTLAAIFLAASVGCLGLWGWSTTARLFGQIRLPMVEYTAEARDGYVITYNLPKPTVGAPFTPNGPWWSEPQSDVWSDSLRGRVSRLGRFFGYKYGVIFPLWYPALVFALAAVGVLRLGRPFTVRSAIIATTVVAGLLGMVVAL